MFYGLVVKFLADLAEIPRYPVPVGQVTEIAVFVLGIDGIEMDMDHLVLVMVEVADDLADLNLGTVLA
jgi:hypothetical protein